MAVQDTERKYFYGPEADQFVFYRIPKALFGAAYHGMSTDAKLLYGLMLDRMGLSARNGWLDDAGRVYIYYPMSEVMDDMDCAHGRATALYRELESYQLIERRKQGQGKPTMIYVLDFVDHNARKRVRKPKPQQGQRKIQQSKPPEIRQEPTAQTAENRQSGLPDSRLPKTGSLDCTKSALSPFINNTDFSDKDLSIHLPRRSGPVASMPDPAEYEEMIDRLHTKIRESIDYSDLIIQYGCDLVDTIVSLMVDECSSTKPFVYINGTSISRRQIRSRLLALHSEHIIEVLDKLPFCDRVSNSRGYLLSMLYNSSTDYEVSYQQNGI